MLDTFSVVLTSGATTVTGVVTAISNGYYQVTYTIAVAGIYLMEVEIQPNSAGSFYEIEGSPFTVSCIVSTTDPATSVLAGTGLTAAIAGEVAEFTVTLYDSGNNQRTSGGD